MDRDQLLEEHGVADDPELLRFLAEAGWLYLRLHRLEPAALLFGALCDLVPDDPSGWVGLADVRRAERRYDEARELYRDAVLCTRADSAALAAVWRSLGDTCREQGDRQGAAEAWAMARDADPFGPEGAVARSLLEVAGRAAGGTS